VNKRRKERNKKGKVTKKRASERYDKRRDEK